MVGLGFLSNNSGNSTFRIQNKAAEREKKDDVKEKNCFSLARCFSSESQTKGSYSGMHESWQRCHLTRFLFFAHTKREEKFQSISHRFNGFFHSYTNVHVRIKEG